MSELFYGPDQAAIHHSDFGNLARDAAGLLLSALADAAHPSGTVVDLGCGSGILAGIVSAAGYDVVGYDISPDMVRLAREQAPAATLQCAPLLDADIPRAVGVVATGEALNYATDPRAGMAAVAGLARRVYDALAPGGVFLLDVSGPGRGGPDRVRQQFHDRDQWTLYMRAEESADGSRLDRWITVFSRDASGCYRRSDEHHVLRLYDPGALLAELRDIGFDAEDVGDYPQTGRSLTPPVGWTVLLARRP